VNVSKFNVPLQNDAKTLYFFVIKLIDAVVLCNLVKIILALQNINVPNPNNGVDVTSFKECIRYF